MKISILLGTKKSGINMQISQMWYKSKSRAEMVNLYVFYGIGSSNSAPLPLYMSIVMIFVYLNGMIYRPQSVDYLVQVGHKRYKRHKWI